MTKKTPKRKPSGPAIPPDPETALARLDVELLRLLQQRAQRAVDLSASGRPVQFPGDPAGLSHPRLAEAIAASKGPLPERTILAVFRELLSGCRELVRRERVAFLGPHYSFSHLAALHHFGQGVEFVPVGSIAAVFEEVNRGHSDFGLVPVENSTDGRIADTLDMFTRLPVRICAQLEMDIHHTLLGKCPRSDVKEIYSKPQVLSQCRNWLAKHLPTARTIEVTSTSTAAQLAKEKPGAAAIASREAGINYGLDVLAENIEDNPANTTRFAVIGEHAAERTGDDRTAMLFQVEHRPGALAEAMNIFKRQGVNLTWIESFPIPNSERAYLFFVEMEGHQTDVPIRRAIGALRHKALRLEILGSFPAIETGH